MPKLKMSALFLATGVLFLCLALVRGGWLPASFRWGPLLWLLVSLALLGFVRVVGVLSRELFPGSRVTTESAFDTRAYAARTYFWAAAGCLVAGFVAVTITTWFMNDGLKISPIVLVVMYVASAGCGSAFFLRGVSIRNRR